MFELVKAGGWLMWPIILCSVAAMALIGQRFASLRTSKVLPDNLVAQIWKMHKNHKLKREHIKTLKAESYLGRILAAGLENKNNSRSVMKEAIEDVGRHVAHDLEKYLNTLGTIAAITPLLGLLGTVIGMIKVFTAITNSGVGNPTVLAGGISEALITTAAGLVVAIPTFMFYRYFQGKVDRLVIEMEAEALKLVEVLAVDRERSGQSS